MPTTALKSLLWPRALNFKEQQSKHQMPISERTCWFMAGCGWWNSLSSSEDADIAQLLPNCANTCVSGLTTLYLFTTFQVLVQVDRESLSAYSKKSCLAIFPNSHTSWGSNHSCSTEGVPAPPAYPPPSTMKTLKKQKKRIKKPECLGEWLEQKEWEIGEHKWCQRFWDNYW